MKLRKIEILNLAVDELLKQYRWLTIAETNELYVYDDGYWQNVPARIIINEYINGILGDKVKEADRNEVYNGIRSRTLKPFKQIENINQNLINTLVGTYNLETGEINEHNADDYFFWILPVTPISEHTSWEKLNDDCEDVPCPKIDRFFREIVKKQGELEEVTEAKVETLYQIIGYCLYRAMPIHKIFILVGEGSNGKSTFLKLLETFLGKENCSRESIQSLAENPFSKVRLFSKLANIYADIPKKPLKNTGQIKMLTGGDPIAGEKKFVQEVVPFTNFAKPIFSCNQIPIAYDETKAWYRRQLIIEFPNVFDDENGNCNKHILDKLTSKVELSGLFERAVKALKKLLKEEQFAYHKTDAEWEDEYLSRSDSIKVFFKQMTEDDPNTQVPKYIIYQNYIKFCQSKKMPPYNERFFWTRARQCHPAYESRPKIGNKLVRCIVGIKLLDPLFANENYPIINTETKLDNFGGEKPER